jgi:hypothetical protein
MSVIPPTCYDYIIGLYSGDCDCYDYAPDDYNVSDSGLYLSDLLEPAFINALLNCDQGASIWDLMGITRDYAIKLFIADTNALLMKENKLTRLPFYGGIGRNKYTKTLDLNFGNYAGVRMFCADIVSGYLRIKKIGTIFDTTGTIDLMIYDNNATLIDTITLTTTADVHTQNVVDIELPLHDEYQDNLEYFFLYQVSSQPKNNDLSCNCEAWTPCFDVNRPYWGQTKSNKKNGWANYMMVGGYNRATLPDFMNIIPTASNNMYGLTFEVELGCKVGEVLCKDQLDYDGNTLAQSIAVAIQMKSAALFIDKLLLSPNLNRIVMIDREQMTKSRDEWLTTYGAMVNYIAENVDIKANDCLTCKDLIVMTKAKILA